MAKLLFVELENVSRYNKNSGARAEGSVWCVQFLVFGFSVFGSRRGAFCYGPW